MSRSIADIAPTHIHGPLPLLLSCATDTEFTPDAQYQKTPCSLSVAISSQE
ncbi:MAG: hypothetical protein QGH72_07395 [Dehalococcoidia bacterium]|nr:hypothetical protein [Dehalococcoidia bacterium]